VITLSADDIKRCREISLGENGLVMDIVRAVCEQVEMPVKTVLSDNKGRTVVQVRWLICYIAHVDYGHSLAAIARVLKYKDHTGVHYGVQQETERRRLLSNSDAGKLDGPVERGKRSTGPDHGNLSERSDTMANAATIAESVEFASAEAIAR
jgi:hypothetical protein